MEKGADSLVGIGIVFSLDLLVMVVYHLINLEFPVACTWNELDHIKFLIIAVDKRGKVIPWGEFI